jgi:hypothetical protein
MRIFGPNKGKIIGGWTKWRNEGSHNLYSSPDITMNKSVMRWVGHVEYMGQKYVQYL